MVVDGIVSDFFNQYRSVSLLHVSCKLIVKIELNLTNLMRVVSQIYPLVLEG